MRLALEVCDHGMAQKIGRQVKITQTEMALDSGIRKQLPQISQHGVIQLSFTVGESGKWIGCAQILVKP